MEKTLPDKTTARDIYNSYVEAGLKIKPPFKGFALGQLRFAFENPELYQVLFVKEKHYESAEEFLAYEGHLEAVLDVMVASLGISRTKAMELLKMLQPLLFGICCAITTGSVPVSFDKCARYLGMHMRGMLISLKARDDARVSFIPTTDEWPSGSLESYIGGECTELARPDNDCRLQALIEQNVMLRSLHESPRYVKDDEWKELDRIALDGFGISRNMLRQKFPELSPADTRLLLLLKLGFSVSLSAVLLGISPASVTKARQRLKAKLYICNVDSFVAAL